MEQLIIGLRMETKNGFCGWYLDVIKDNERLMEPMQVPSESAYALAQDFQRAMQESPDELPNFQLPVLVQSGHNAILAAVKRELLLAEEQATRIPTLRKQLQSFTQSSGTMKEA